MTLPSSSFAPSGSLALPEARPVRDALWMAHRVVTAPILAAWSLLAAAFGALLVRAVVVMVLGNLSGFDGGALAVLAFAAFVSAYVGFHVNCTMKVAMRLIRDDPDVAWPATGAVVTFAPFLAALHIASMMSWT